MAMAAVVATLGAGCRWDKSDSRFGWAAQRSDAFVETPKAAVETTALPLFLHFIEFLYLHYHLSVVEFFCESAKAPCSLT